MVIIRVGIAQNRNNTRFEDHSTLGGGDMGSNRTSSNDSAYPMNGIKVHISKMTETSSPSLDSCNTFKPKFGSDIVHMGEGYSWIDDLIFLNRTWLYLSLPVNRPRTT
jgi:hypothetical protein